MIGKMADPNPNVPSPTSRLVAPVKTSTQPRHKPLRDNVTVIYWRPLRQEPHVAICSSPLGHTSSSEISWNGTWRNGLSLPLMQPTLFFHRNMSSG